VGDDPAAVEANLEAIFATLGLRREQTVTARQVHGNHVAIVGSGECNTVIPQTDGLITAEVGTALLLRFADCLPLLLYDPPHRVIALVHVGWRGCVAGVVDHALAVLQTTYGCRPHDLLAGLGPAIGPCCYEVGLDLVEHIERIFGRGHGLLLGQADGTTRFDLPAAVQRQLLAAGVGEIEQSGLCTHCRTDEFFSHRAEEGHTGRFAAVLALSQIAHAPRGS